MKVSGFEMFYKRVRLYAAGPGGRQALAPCSEPQQVSAGAVCRQFWEGRSSLSSPSVCLCPSVRPSAGAPVPLRASSRSPAGACPWSVSVRALCLQMYIFKRDLNCLFLEAGRGGVRRGLALLSAGPSVFYLYTEIQ